MAHSCDLQEDKVLQGLKESGLLDALTATSASTSLEAAAEES